MYLCIYIYIYQMARYRPLDIDMVYIYMFYTHDTYCVSGFRVCKGMAFTSHSLQYTVVCTSSFGLPSQKKKKQTITLWTAPMKYLEGLVLPAIAESKDQIKIKRFLFDSSVRGYLQNMPCQPWLVPDLSESKKIWGRFWNRIPHLSVVIVARVTHQPGLFFCSTRDVVQCIWANTTSLNPDQEIPKIIITIIIIVIITIITIIIK